MEDEMKGSLDMPKYCFSVRNHKIDCIPCDRAECFRAELLEAESSAFHTDRLAEATRSINEILSGLQPDTPDQSLAFIQTGMGIMLTWVTPEHDAALSKDELAVTTEDDRETLAKALNLKNIRT